MASRLRMVRVLSAAAVAATVAVGCGSGGSEERELTVTSQVISDATTPRLRALVPDEEGAWPVVVLLHGVNGSGEDMVELGSRLASAGALVFAPTYSTDLDTEEGLVRAADDLVCAYQLARRSASELGGDLTQPVTVVGWSLGADLAVLGSLQGSGENTSTRCPGEAPQPDVVVGMSGCYYDYEGNPVTWFDDVSGWSSKGADVYLVSGSDDTVCPAWQTEQLAASLRAAGQEIELVELEGANHYAPVFHDVRDGQWQVITDDPAGDVAVTTILDAIDAARENRSSS